MVSLNPLGAAVMACFSGLFIDKLGRKGTMLLSNFLLAISCILVHLNLKIVHNKVTYDNNGWEVYNRFYNSFIFKFNSFI